MTEKQIDRDILGIEEGECCCREGRYSIQILSAALLVFEMEIGLKRDDIPRFKYCPWCGTNRENPTFSLPTREQPLPCVK